MPATAFGRPLHLDDRWEDGSIYTFYLRTDGPTPAFSPPQASSAASQGAPVVRGAPIHGAVEPFRSNLVLVRSPQGGRDLDRIVQEHRQAVAGGMPGARLVREGRTTVAGLAAHELEYQVTLDPPLPPLQQWQALFVRDGQAYQLCATSPRERFAKERPHFRALVDSWR